MCRSRKACKHTVTPDGLSRQIAEGGGWDSVVTNHDVLIGAVSAPSRRATDSLLLPWSFCSSKSLVRRLKDENLLPEAGFVSVDFRSEFSLEGENKI
jgi:hypothetical protein